jgi:group I intron endonuclease
MKLDILKDNKGRTGIYRWVHLKTGRSYIGSAIDLSRRLSKYYQLSQLIKDNMIIYKALLKHGYSAFSLEILE